MGDGSRIANRPVEDPDRQLGSSGASSRISLCAPSKIGFSATLTVTVADTVRSPLVPDIATFDPAQATGIPPYSPLEVTEAETWNLFDLSTNTT